MQIKKKTIASEIFTGSMADISFLLIIYFMITSAFSTDRGLDFALPEETDTPEIKQEDAIEVHVMPGGAIEVDKKAIPMNGLLPYILEKLQKNPEKPVILRTDPDATYGDMISVFDRLRRANEEWTEPIEGSEERRALYQDVHGKDLTEIKTISIPTQREIENIWILLGMG
jgi:biopolymer transport protein ExbD